MERDGACDSPSWVGCRVAHPAEAARSVARVMPVRTRRAGMATSGQSAGARADGAHGVEPGGGGGKPRRGAGRPRTIGAASSKPLGYRLPVPRRRCLIVVGRFSGPASDTSRVLVGVHAGMGVLTDAGGVRVYGWTAGPGVRARGVSGAAPAGEEMAAACRTPRPAGSHRLPSIESEDAAKRIHG